MKPIDYLRAMTRRKPKYATGGIVHAPAIVDETGCTLTVDNRDGRYTMPTGLIRIEHDLTEHEVDQIRQRFQTATAPPPAAKPKSQSDPPWTNRTNMSGTCGCLAIYSKCYCGH